MRPMERLKAAGRLGERVLARLDPILEIVTGNLWLDGLVFRRKAVVRARRRVFVDAEGNVVRVEQPDVPNNE